MPTDTDDQSDPFDSLLTLHTPVDSKRPKQSTLNSTLHGASQAPAEMWNDLVQTGEAMLNEFGNDVDFQQYQFDLNDPGPAGNLTREMGGFLGTMAGATKFLKGFSWFARLAGAGKVGRIAAGTVAGVPADIVSTPVDTPNLSNFLRDLGIQNEVTEYLAFDPERDDSHLEQRIKAAIEGGVLGTVAEAALIPVLRHLRSVKHAENPLGEEVFGETLTGVRPDAPTAGLNPEQLQDAASRGVLHEVTTSADRSKLVAEMIENVTKQKQGKVTLEEISEHIVNQGFNGAGATLDMINIASKTLRDSGDLAAVGKAPVSIVESQRLARAAAEEIVDAPDEAIARAQELWKSTENIHVEMTMLRATMQNYAKRTDDLLERLAAGSASEADKLNAIGEITRLLDLETHVIGTGTNLGRGLRSMGATVDGSAFALGSLTDDALRNADDAGKQQLRDLLEQFGGDDIQAIAKKYIKLRGSGKSVKDTLKALKKTRSKEWKDAILEYRVINMLSGPATPTMALIGNSMAFFNQHLLEPFVAAGISRVRGVFGGSQAVTTKEIATRMTGTRLAINDLFKGPDGLLGQIKTKKGEFSLTDFMAEKSIDPRTRASLEGITEGKAAAAMRGLPVAQLPVARGVVEGAARLTEFGRHISVTPLNALDTVFKNASYRAEIMAAAHRVTARGVPDNPQLAGKQAGELIEDLLQYAKNGNAEFLVAQGYKGTALRQRAKTLAKMHDRALKASRDTVFQGQLSKSFEDFGNALNKDTRFAFMARLLIPFYRTPMNLLKFVGQRTPGLHKFSDEMTEMLNGSRGAHAKAMAEARLVVGGGLYIAGMNLVGAGLITGRHEASERNDKLAAGIPEYSILIGNRFVKYNRLDPVAMFFGIVADLHTASAHLEDGQFREALGAVWLGVVEQTANKTWMQSVGKAFQALHNPDMALDLLVDAARPSVGLPPAAAFRTFNTVTDGHLREVRTFMDKFLQDLPGGSRQNNVRTDVLGNEVKVPRTMIDVISQGLGFRTSKLSESPAMREMARLDALNVDRDPTILGVELTRSETQAWKKILREDVKARDVLDRVVSSSQYKSLSAAHKKKVLGAVQRRIRKVARTLLLRNDPKLRAQITERRKHLLQLLETSGTDKPAESFQEIMDFNARFDFDRTDQ